MRATEARGDATQPRRRAAPRRRLLLADLRDSGSIEADVEIVLMLQRRRQLLATVWQPRRSARRADG